jgi:hypothetical protein
MSGSVSGSNSSRDSSRAHEPPSCALDSPPLASIEIVRSCAVSCRRRTPTVSLLGTTRVCIQPSEELHTRSCGRLSSTSSMMTKHGLSSMPPHDSTLPASSPAYTVNLRTGPSP